MSRIPLAAAAWAAGHAAMTAYWALGGTAGLGLLSEGIREEADARNTAFLALLWAVVAAKLIATALALSLRDPARWSRPVRLVLATLALAGGAGMALYGVAGIAAAAVAVLGITGDAEAEASIWYLVIWFPLWLLGGVLFLLTGRHAIRTPR